MNLSSKETVREFDVIVVGAGSAGSAAAWMLAQGGLKVALVEERDQAEAGARWQNEMLPWMFDRAGIDSHDLLESNTLTGRFTLLGRNSAARITVDDNPLRVVDMRRLVAHLQAAAETSGVTILSRTKAVCFEFDGERPVIVQTETSPKQRKRYRTKLRARLFVDASGMQGALRNLVPALAQACGEVAPSDTCCAAREICAVKDQAGAQSFLDRHGLQAGDMVGFGGIDGGYSLLCISLHSDLQQVEIGCKTIADGKHLNGADWIARIKEQEPWIGERVYGGQGYIPLRASYKKLVAPGIALIGDAACQVHSFCGCGAGMGLIAARILSDVVTTASDPGASDVLASYQSLFDKEFGLRLIVADIFRRAFHSLLEDEVELLIGSGLIQAAFFRSILVQNQPKPTDLELVALASSIRGIPGLAMRLLPHIAKAIIAVGMFEARQREHDISEVISKLLK